MNMPKYEEQLAFTVTVTKKDEPKQVFKIYTNGAIDGFPTTNKDEGIKVSISNNIQIFIHEAYVRGENIGRAIAEFMNTDEIKKLQESHKQKSSLPEKKDVDEVSGGSHSVAL